MQRLGFFKKLTSGRLRLNRNNFINESEIRAEDSIQNQKTLPFTAGFFCCKLLSLRGDGRFWSVFDFGFLCFYYSFFLAFYQSFVYKQII